jgi:RNA polymerase sigma factor (sigma-70 family)
VGRPAGPRREVPAARLAAARALFDKNVRFAPWVCRKFCLQTGGRRFARLHYDEYLSHANEGMWMACLRYEPGRGTTLATYAHKCIWRRMLVHLKSQRARTKRLFRTWLGADLLLHDTGDPQAPDPARRLVRADAARLAARLMECHVGRRERTAIRMRAEGKTLKEIGERLGVSKERARQLTNRARLAAADFPTAAEETESRGRPAVRRPRRERMPQTEDLWSDDSPSAANSLRAWEDFDG